MTLDDIQGLSRAFAPVVADAIKAATEPLIARISELERRPTDADVEARVSKAVAEAVAAIPPGPAGKDGAPGEKGAAGERGEVGPQGEAGPQGERGEKGEPGERGEKGEPGRDAPEVTDEQIEAAVLRLLTPVEGQRGLIAEQVQRWMELNPPPAGPQGEPGPTGERGEQGPAGEKGERGEQGLPGERGEKGEPGADGLGIAGMLIDRAGELVATMTDGSIRSLGPVVGRDGVDGKPGEKGEPGRDGFSLSAFDVTKTGDRTLELSFEEGEQRFTAEVEFAIPIYRGAYKAETEYAPGDEVTWGGSVWHCLALTKDKPDGSDAWALKVRRGRDGKDGKDGEKGAPGPKGDPGRDGRTWA